MQATIIGIISGLVTIILIKLLKKLDKATAYALILVGIGYLYVGFTWSDTASLVITSVQAAGFMLIAYYGIKNRYLLALGFFLHGAWDIVYNVLPLAKLLPPHYDLFCLAIDFVIGIYLLRLASHQSKRTNLTFVL